MLEVVQKSGKNDTSNFCVGSLFRSYVPIDVYSGAGSFATFEFLRTGCARVGVVKRIANLADLGPFYPPF